MKTADRLLWGAIDGAILIAVLGMVCLIALQVGSRVAGASLQWTEELSRFLFIWTVWLGLAASFRSGAHPTLIVVPDHAPPVIRLIFLTIRVGATVLLFLAVSWYGFKLLHQQIISGEQSPILQVGMWVATLPLVLGSALAIVGVILDAAVGQWHRPEFATVVASAEEHLK